MIFDEFSYQIIEPIDNFLHTLSRIDINTQIFLKTIPNDEDRLALDIDKQATMREFILEICLRMVESGFSSLYDCFSFVVEFIEQFKPAYLEAQKKDLVDFYPTTPNKDIFHKHETVDDFMNSEFTRIKEEIKKSLLNTNKFGRKLNSK